VYKKNILIIIMFFFGCANFAFADELMQKLAPAAQNSETTGEDSKVDAKQITLELSGAWARASMSSNSNSAAYMSITNPTNKQITILGASAAIVSNNVELHKSFVDEKGISRMTSIDKIVVPANSTIALAPGGIHVMLFELKRKLTAGDKFKMHLELESAESVSIDVEVK
jgi:periplasmic copper chaperone A